MSGTDTALFVPAIAQVVAAGATVFLAIKTRRLAIETRDVATATAIGALASAEGAAATLQLAEEARSDRELTWQPVLSLLSTCQPPKAGTRWVPLCVAHDSNVGGGQHSLPAP